jgi:hypothetical protein
MVAGSLLITVVSVVITERRFPQWFDREYEVRRELLHDRVEENPEKPVCLLVGSSLIDAWPLHKRVSRLAPAAQSDYTEMCIVRITAHNSYGRNSAM